MTVFGGLCSCVHSHNEMVHGGGRCGGGGAAVGGVSTGVNNRVTTVLTCNVCAVLVI